MNEETGGRSNALKSIAADYQTTRLAFHCLLDELSEEDLRRPSHNPGWKNGEILFHMTFGFIIVSALLPMVKLWSHLPKGFSKGFSWVLNGTPGVFNWINGIGARGGGSFYRGKRIGPKFDKAYNSLLRKLNSVKTKDLERGMYFPTKWDGLFKKYMTVEDVLRFPVIHFNFHLNQISK